MWLSFFVDGSEQQCYSAENTESNIDLYSAKEGSTLFDYFTLDNIEWESDASISIFWRISK